MKQVGTWILLLAVTLPLGMVLITSTDLPLGETVSQWVWFDRTMPLAVYKGYDYELFCWADGYWNSLGRQTAMANSLVYEAPMNALLTACTPHIRKDVNTYTDFPQIVELQAETVPIDTALFRYAFRIRTQGGTVVIMDLYGAVFHAFLGGGYLGGEHTPVSRWMVDAGLRKEKTKTPRCFRPLGGTRSRSGLGRKGERFSS